MVSLGRLLLALITTGALASCGVSSKKVPEPDAGPPASPCPRGCDDGDPCTADICDSASGCQHQARADGAACGEGLCCAGKCVQAASDPSNCGGCGVACAGGMKCWAAQCKTCSQSFSGQTDYLAEETVKSVAVADLNADGRGDLVALLRSQYVHGPVGPSPRPPGGYIAVLLNHGDGTFASPAFYETGSFAVALAIADLNADGYPDLALSTWDEYSEAPRTGDLITLMNNKDGTFAERTEYGTDVLALWGLGVGDLDGDGKPDLAAITTPAGEGGVPLPGEVWLYTNEGGVFPSNEKRSVDGQPAWLAVADFDRDRKPDLAFANRATRHPTVWVNAGAGSFEAKVSDTEMLTHYGSVAGVVGDLDRDGAPDIVSANSEQGELVVLMNSGDGTFGRTVEHQLGGPTESLAISDVDGDGIVDLMALMRVSAPEPQYWAGQVRVLHGLGDGAFEVATDDVPIAGQPVAVAAGDLNGDGMPDLALGGWSGVSVLLSKCE